MRRRLIVRRVGCVVALAVFAAVPLVSRDAAVAADRRSPVAGIGREAGAWNQAAPGVEIHPADGDAFGDVAITVAVPGAGRSATVTVRDGAVLLVSGLRPVDGTVTFRTNALGPGVHRIAADLVDSGRACAVGAGTASYGTGTGVGNVELTIPRGALTIAAPSAVRGGAAIADVVITDTRAGNLGFTASVTVGTVGGDGMGSVRGSQVGLVHVHAVQVPGNALRARDVTGIDIRAGDPGLGRPRVFATYPAGLSTGTVRVQGRLDVRSAGDSRQMTTTRLVFTAI